MRVGETIEGWILSFEFDSTDESGKAYERARDIVFERNIDGSVYRVFVNHRPHVVALGFPDIPRRDKNDLVTAMSAGRDAPLPEEILLPLVLRHAEIRIPGLKVERRGNRPIDIKFE